MIVSTADFWLACKEVYSALNIIITRLHVAAGAINYLGIRANDELVPVEVIESERTFHVPFPYTLVMSDGDTWHMFTHDGTENSQVELEFIMSNDYLVHAVLELAK